MLTKKDKHLAAARKHLDVGNLGKAFVEFQAAKLEDPGDIRTRLHLAEIHVKRGELDQAADVYIETAELYQASGSFQRAAAVYKSVLKLAPARVHVRIKLAEVYEAIGLFSDASAEYEAAASAFEGANRLQEAIRTLSKLLTKNPGMVDVRVRLADLAMRDGQTDLAITEWKRAAHEFEALGRIDDQIAVIERVLRENRSDADLVLKLAAHRLKGGQAKAALSILDRYLPSLPRSEAMFVLLIEAFQVLDREGASGVEFPTLRELCRTGIRLHEPDVAGPTLSRVTEPARPTRSQTRRVRVFISHATGDRHRVEREVVSLLRDNGIQVWYSKTDIRSAAEWHAEILQALEECDWFLIALTPKAAQSEWVKDELHWAFDHRKGRVVPVLLEDCRLQDFHIRLLRIQCVDFRAPSEEQRTRLLRTWHQDPSET